jgi:benzylsuccinate CoA-transferase BbsF subunit
MTVPEARELALQLVDWADVIVENFSPRAMKKWGLDYQTLSSTRPGLVMLSSCLNGQTGPESALAGYGTMGASLAGFGFLTGWPDRPPSGPLLAYTDYVSPRFATAALLAAIDVQRRTGKGQHVDLAQSECGVHFLGPPALDYLANGAVWKAHGNAHREYAPSGVYPCQGDDRWLALAAPDGDAWQRLCASSGAGWERDARFASTADRLANRAELDLEISAWTKGFSADALEARLQDARLPAHRVSTSTDLFADPQLAAREHFVWLEHVECGLTPLEGARARLSRTPGAPQSHGPTVGEHNEFVLRELLGMSDEQMTELVISGALE